MSDPYRVTAVIHAQADDRDVALQLNGTRAREVAERRLGPHTHLLPDELPHEVVIRWRQRAIDAEWLSRRYTALRGLVFEKDVSLLVEADRRFQAAEEARDG